MRVLGYVRVSTDEQSMSGAGLEAQRQTILAECRRRGWELVEVVEDRGYSARDLKRPAIRAALEELERGKADGLVVAKLDRLSRSMLDFTAIMAKAQRQSWALVALDCAVDTTTPAGEAMANVLATFAQFERRLIGQRTREALAEKRSQGVRLGRPRQLSEEIVERIRSERESGQTLGAIADALNRNGVPTAQGGARWWPSTVRAVLGSPGPLGLSGSPRSMRTSGEKGPL
jgi:DNA invertase Pin-like site-specific DNA recombinase